jgi:hypothetical protein
MTINAAIYGDRLYRISFARREQPDNRARGKRKGFFRELSFPTWIDNPSHEKYRTGLIVLDDEYKRVVCPEYRYRPRICRCSSPGHHNRRRGCGLGVFLVYINESLVDNVADKKFFVPSIPE